MDATSVFGLSLEGMESEKSRQYCLDPEGDQESKNVHRHKSLQGWKKNGRVGGKRVSKIRV